ncbi:hypothetical protein D3C76_889760 [compost metagenome]
MPGKDIIYNALLRLSSDKMPFDLIIFYILSPPLSFLVLIIEGGSGTENAIFLVQHTHFLDINDLYSSRKTSLVHCSLDCSSSCSTVGLPVASVY